MLTGGATPILVDPSGKNEKADTWGYSLGSLCVLCVQKPTGDGKG
jgi:hypothetical protein